MQIVTVRLDRIFDVVHTTHDRKNGTFFGFQCGSRRVCGIGAPGRPRIEAGAVLSVCLRLENDWTTLVGWYNHTTAETVLESIAAKTFGMVMPSIIAAVILWNAPHLLQLLFVPMILAWGYAGMQEIRFLRRVRAELARLRSAPVPHIRFPFDADRTNGPQQHGTGHRTGTTLGVPLPETPDTTSRSA